MSDREFVYIIAWSDKGPSKIGRTNNLAARLASLQTAHPYKLHVYYAFDVWPYAAPLEAACHEAAGVHRLRGEWFDLTPLRALQIVEKALAKATVRRRAALRKKARLPRDQAAISELKWLRNAD